MDVGMGAIALDLQRLMDRLSAEWVENGKIERLWSRDASLWTGKDEDCWLGWLDVAQVRPDQLECLRVFQQDVRSAPFDHAVLLGMGGSSLAADVLWHRFGQVGGAPKFQILDSTDPAQVRSVEGAIDLRRTLFIVSSKSGKTLEVSCLYSYFWHLIEACTAGKGVGQQFVAVTDPQSELDEMAKELGFRHVFHGLPSVGGRYSALSSFGIVPAAIMGLDFECLLTRAVSMRSRCLELVPFHENPGACLGIALGAAVQTGRDKLTIVTSPRLEKFGAWVEQLLAESTGKAGTGVIPVDGESLGQSNVYGRDRVFVYIRDELVPDAAQDDAVGKLERDEFPVIRISLADPYDLGREFFRWEFATAVAGAVLGIHPFDQPDVEESKIIARRLTNGYGKGRLFPVDDPVASDGELELHGVLGQDLSVKDKDVAGLSIDEVIATYCADVSAEGYLAILAYIEMSPLHTHLLQRLRIAIRNGRGVATCVGFGPRFLHSTGQMHKGGPSNGTFLQITCLDTVEIGVPGEEYSFGIVKAAQARADLEVLHGLGRPVLRVHVVGELVGGLERLARVVEQHLRVK